jgi:hypothetical protein
MAMNCWNMLKGVNMECINKSYYYFNAFAGYFLTILQNARSIYQEDTEQAVQ